MSAFTEIQVEELRAMVEQFEEAVKELNGANVRSTQSTIFIALPKALWRSCGVCICTECVDLGASPVWDTLAVARSNDEKHRFLSTAWTVHMPDFSQPLSTRRKVKS